MHSLKYLVQVTADIRGIFKDWWRTMLIICHDFGIFVGMDLLMMWIYNLNKHFKIGEISM